MSLTDKQKANLETRAAVLKALAHPTRLFIVEIIDEEARSVGELTEMIGLDISSISNHLSILKNAGLVNTEKKGKQVFYSLRMRCVLNFLFCIEAVLMEQAKDRMSAIK